MSLLAHESIGVVREQIPDLADGAFAENIVTEGIDIATARIGDRILAGVAVLEVTQIGKECHHGCVIRELTGDCIMPREGVFARVVDDGMVRVGDTIEILAGSAGG